jgi:hypothetical protein
MELNEFISGERLQEIADITHIGVVSCNMPNQLPNTKTVLRKKDEFYLKDNENIIFVYGHDLDLFFRETFPKINKPVKLITHNADEPVEERFIQFLNSNKIIKWYAQNAVVNHPKLIPIPIGIANKQWPHGNLNTLKNVIDKGVKKEILVYKNFDINTNFYQRKTIDTVTANNGIHMGSHLAHDQYLEKMASSLFIISPPGNGVDCHRIWEALYLGCVPIVQQNDCFRNFTELPILFINNWNDVTVSFLKNQVSNFYNKTFDTTKLKLSFWKKLIVEG